MSGSNEYDHAKLFPDFRAECDEHLTSAGQVLLDLESAPERLDRQQLDNLFRNFHTVKGLSAMVGLQEAEELSHALEEYLGTIRKGRIALSQEGVAVLVQGVNLLEQVIAARGEGQLIPAISGLVNRVASLSPISDNNSPSVSDSAAIPFEMRNDPYTQANAAVSAGKKVCRLQFASSTNLTKRGITVSVIRDRLREAGEIVFAEPQVVPGGVSFTFLVIERKANFSIDFQDEGLLLEQYKPVQESASTVSS